MADRVHAAQDHICRGLEEVDGGSFREDRWERPGGGGGRSRVLQDSTHLEKAGVNVSVVHGELNEQAAAAMRGRGLSTEDPRFFATGLSLVIHPRNPFAPIVHANFRYFELGDAAAPAAWWFGGGTDLTPVYLFEEDARHFHQTLKDWCDRHDPAFYADFKKRCDDYFHIRHRGERRGVGGVFFDDLHDRDPEALLAFAGGGLDAFLPAYRPILEERLGTPYGDAEREWQGLRRGRYVEFNLVWDRGTSFGLRTDARVESVLMSLPLTARWEYCHEPDPEQERLLQVLREPVDWV